MSSLEEYFVNAIRYRYLDFGGRARRKAFWMFWLFHLLFFAVLMVALWPYPGPLKGLVAGLASLAIALPTLGVKVRRLHDVGKSGWFLLVGAVPVVGTFIVLYFVGFKEGDHGPNRYGEDPKDPYDDLDETEDFERVLDR